MEHQRGKETIKLKINISRKCSHSSTFEGEYEWKNLEQSPDTFVSFFLCTTEYFHSEVDTSISFHYYTFIRESLTFLLTTWNKCLFSCWNPIILEYFNWASSPNECLELDHDDSGTLAARIRAWNYRLRNQTESKWYLNFFYCCWFCYFHYLFIGCKCCNLWFIDTNSGRFPPTVKDLTERKGLTELLIL